MALTTWEAKEKGASNGKLRIIGHSSPEKLDSSPCSMEKDDILYRSRRL